MRVQLAALRTDSRNHHEWSYTAPDTLGAGALKVACTHDLYTSAILSRSQAKQSSHMHNGTMLLGFHASRGPAPGLNAVRPGAQRL